MVVINVKNLSNVQTHGAQFQTMGEAQPWVDECVQKNKWGKAAGFYQISRLSQEELAQEISRQTLDGFGQELQEPLIEIPAQYTIEILDVTLEYEAEKQKRIDRNAKRAQIKKLKNKGLSSSEIKAVVETLLQVLDLSDEFVE